MPFSSRSPNAPVKVAATSIVCRVWSRYSAKLPSVAPVPWKSAQPGPGYSKFVPSTAS
jgi:hypothetical protein